MRRDILFKTFLFLVLVCTLAYFVNAYASSFLNPFVPRSYNRISRHGLYLVWMVCVFAIGKYSFKKSGIKWAGVIWKWLYVAIISYTVISELLGFMIPTFGFFIHSAMAHTAFIFCSPIPFFALMMIVRWQQQKKTL